MSLNSLNSSRQLGELNASREKNAVQTGLTRGAKGLMCVWGCKIHAYTLVPKNTTKLAAIKFTVQKAHWLHFQWILLYFTRFY